MRPTDAEIAAMGDKNMQPGGQESPYAPGMPPGGFVYLGAAPPGQKTATEVTMGLSQLGSTWPYPSQLAPAPQPGSTKDSERDTLLTIIAILMKNADMLQMQISDELIYDTQPAKLFHSSEMSAYRLFVMPA